jgi:membrane associated rhomboid family serine protease
MVRYSCAGCGAAVDLPMPALPGQSVACPHCRSDMSPAPQPSAPQARRSRAEAPPFRPPARRRTWTLRRQTHVLIGIVVLLWVVAIVEVFLPGEDALIRLGGILPRSVPSLLHIFTAPFIHDGFGHLIANTVVLVPLGWLVMLRGPREFLLASLISMVVSGLGVWLVASPDRLHIGASGVIFGYLGFLLVCGYLERSCFSFLLAVGVCVLFGGMLWGVLPMRRDISWQGHLFGFVGGALSAWLIAPRYPVPRAQADLA